jgi:SAM-dependent methyltransferase
MARNELQGVLDGLLSGRRGLRVLDAGCGSRTHIDLPSDAIMTGLDISRESAVRNSAIKNVILGDVQTHVFPKDSFDAIVCWEVLEHVEHPMRALSLMFDAVAENGIVVLALPNAHSLKGLVTKFTPHGFHIWFLRRWLHEANAGKPGFAPFPTPLKWSLAPNALLSHCRKRGAEVVYFRAYVGARIAALRRRFWIGYCVYVALAGLLNFVSFGRSNFALSDMYVVLRRRPA